MDSRRYLAGADCGRHVHAHGLHIEQHCAQYVDRVDNLDEQRYRRGKQRIE